MPEIKVGVGESFPIEFEHIRFESFRGDFNGLTDLNVKDTATKLGLPIIQDDGKFYIKGEGENKLEITEEFKTSDSATMFKKISETLGDTEAKKFQDHLNAKKTSFPTDAEQTHSRAASAPSSDAVSDRAGLKDDKAPSVDSAESKWFDKSMTIAAAKFVLLAGLTVGALFLINAQNNGCWIFNSAGEKQQRVATSTENGKCNLCYDDTNLSTGVTLCKSYCGGNQAGNCLVNPPIPVFPDTN